MSDNHHNSSDLSHPQPKQTVDESRLNPDRASRTPFARKDPLEGKTIGENSRYLLQTLLGQGGMSKVYRALDTKFEDRVVAIKLMTNYSAAGSNNLIKRFMGEVKAISRLKHPNIIQILDFGVTPDAAPFSGAPFYVMEYFTGKTLQNLLSENKTLSLDSLANIMCQVCAGLKEAHQKGIIHRDLKPENIFLVAGGAFGEIVKILDFGIAKNISADAQKYTQLTQEGSFIGTYRYAAPEQCRGLTNIDQRTDIYSLGVILYEAICGKNPYDLDDDLNTSQADWIACHIRVPPKPLKQQPGCEKIKDKLENIVMKCLAKSPQDRFSDIGELQNAIVDIFSVKTVVETTTNNPPFSSNNQVNPKSFSVAPQHQKTSSRRKVLQYGGLMLGGIFLTVLLTKILQPEPEEPLTQAPDQPKLAIAPVKDMQLNSSGEVWSLAISPDGEIIASGNDLGTIELFNRQTGDITKILGEHENVIRALVFIPQTDRLISGDGDGNIKVWNQENSKKELQLQGHEASIWSLAISPDGETLISSSEDASLRIWNLKTGETDGIIFAHNEVVYALAFSPDGRVFASAGKDNQIKIWNAKDGSLLKSFLGHQDAVRAIAITPDNQYLVSASWDKTVKVWELKSGELITTFTGHQGRVVTVAVSNDSRTVFSGSLDNTIKVWSLEKAKLITTLSQHQNWVLALATSQPENLLVSGGKDTTIQLWQY